MERHPNSIFSRALLVAALLATAAANSVNITYSGLYYEVFVENNDFNNLAAQISSSFWWNNETAAEAACYLVNGTLGSPAPSFAWTKTLAFTAVVFNASTGLCSSYSESSFNLVTFALSRDLPTPSPSPEESPSPSPEVSPSPSPEASPSPSPEASPSPSPEASPSPSPEASPSPSPLALDCNLAAFSPAILSSRLNSQFCAATKAVQRGKQSKFVTNVTLSLLDATNQPAAINITNIVTNKATASWHCRCRPTNGNNCTCIPNAVLLGGGNFLAMPQWRRNTLPGPIVDTTLQVSFTATAGDGSTCSGSAIICSVWGLRRNKPPPECTPFNSTGVTRPALTCI